jgi:hypothetical protein
VLVIATLCTIGALGLLLVGGLNALSSRAERELGAYPFMQEDWLRYLLPTKFVQDAPAGRILLTGPSTVRENLLYERFAAAFPGQVIIQGGISLGTLDDVTAALRYVREVYGNAAMPDTVVLGISPRFIANIPNNRPFKNGISRYSPYFSATRSDSGIELSPKGPVASLVSRARFLIYKQPDRYRTAIFALLSQLLGGDTTSRADDGKTALGRQVDRFFRQPALRRLFAGTRFSRALDYDFSTVLAWLASPYKYRLDAPADLEGLVTWMNGEDVWWHDVHTWNPRDTEQTTRASLERFNALIRASDIELYVINMPERDVSRARYDRDNYAAYLELVRDTLDNAHFLDLQEFLRTEEFHDLEHSRYPGSLRLTDRVISYMKGTD